MAMQVGFLGRLPVTLSVEAAAAIVRYDSMLLDEKLKEATVRLCPHCAVQCVKTDGCDTMHCGRDAPDKGHKVWYSKGCGKSFEFSKPVCSKTVALRRFNIPRFLGQKDAQEKNHQIGSKKK